MLSNAKKPPSTSTKKAAHGANISAVRGLVVSINNVLMSASPVSWVVVLA